MKIPFTIESAGLNAAYVVYGNLRCPIEWQTEDQKPKLIESAKEMITQHVLRNETLR